MIVVDSDTTEHTIKLIPRYTPMGTVVVNIYNQTNRVETETILSGYTVTDGVFSFEFPFGYTFEQDVKYRVKIKEGQEVVYRGKLIAINQGTQNYDPSEGLYTYSNI